MQYNLIPCYVFDEDAFIDNYKLFESTFKKYYANYCVAYSYKTNYTPYVCRLVKKLGAYAEVVSQMEYDLAKEIGYTDDKIIFNGPCKGIYPPCILNVDSIEEIKKTDNKIGLRINIDVGQGFVSRFGIDESQLDEAFKIAGDRIVGIHCHISQARSIEAWRKRIETMLSIADKYFGEAGPEYIDLGSGMYGDMNPVLKNQFSNVPSYEEYAKVVAGAMAKHYPDHKPILFTEPGTTLINKYIEFICQVESIKFIKDKCFITLNGSKNNLGEICELKKLPIRIIKNSDKQFSVNDAVFNGYTCLEHDVMYSGFSGEIGIGDYVVFENVGGYSIVSKPPFIKPNCAMFTKEGKLIKREETAKEIFVTYE